METLLSKIAALDAKIFTLENNKRETEQLIRKERAERETLADKAVSEMIENGCVNAEVSGLLWGIKNNPPKPVIIDEKLIPEKFYVTKKELSKMLINAASTSGEQIPGVSWDNGSVSLTVRGKK